MITVVEQPDGRWLIMSTVSEREAAKRGIAPGDYQEGWVNPQGIVGRMNGGRAKRSVALVQAMINAMRDSGLEVTVKAIKG